MLFTNRLKEATMRGKSIISVMIVVSMLLFISTAGAGPWKGWRGSGGWGMGSQYNSMYNPATVEAISGTVEAVDKVTPMKGMNSGVHVMLKTDKETISFISARNGMSNGSIQRYRRAIRSR